MNIRKLGLAFFIAALLLASFPVAGVFAAPPCQDDSPGDDLEQSWRNKLSQLRGEIAFLNNFQTKPGQGQDASIAPYLDRYRATLASAQALLVNGGFSTNGQVNNQNQARRSNQQMGTFLSQLRGLRDKIAEGGQDNNRNNGNNFAGNNGGVGIPVTGGAGNNNQNNNQANNQNNNNQNNQTANFGVGQIREVQAAQAWFNRFRTKPGQNRNNDNISRYLDQYAFALQQANSILVGGGAATDQQGNMLTWGSPEHQLASYIHMMRGLRQKIGEGGRDNNNNNGNNN